MQQPEEELKYRIIKSSIKKFGDFEKSVEINPIEISGEIGFSYKISENLISTVIKDLTDTIETDAKKRGFKVTQVK